MSINAQIIIAEDIETLPAGNNGQLTKMVNPVLKMRVPFIPAGLTFVVSVITTGIDFNKKHDFSIELVKEDSTDSGQDKVIYSTGSQILNPNKNVTDNFNFNIDLKNTPFREEGMYKVIFKIDGTSHSQQFEVVADENLLKE
ncbi:hypothetical protein SAMN04488102_101376 [Alkalibacterium subtropicum]|uniref:Uncharacterized protein n=1 Tax=Alkalibacterium subtropicum TaxID=753702 RepID=A0A1I1EVF9_9LACT|nr:hypothetical protein [Alkalibacterium subtropicum]SFB91094.1 hypothetical protein SAMN04488102_101376 [Alkalibacterium subtropicum]